MMRAGVNWLTAYGKSRETGTISRAFFSFYLSSVLEGSFFVVDFLSFVNCKCLIGRM